MKFLSKASEDDMIKLFLETEIKSDRFKEKLECVIKEIENETSIRFSIESDDEEARFIRRRVLARYRGYGMDQELFKGFPAVDDWNWVLLTREDLQKIKYINYSYWIELSKGSRYAADAVQSIRENIEVYGVSNAGFIKAAEDVRNNKRFPPIILVAAYENPMDMVLVEGHLRLTAYMLASDHIDNVKAMIGYAPLELLKKWGLF